MNKKIIKKSQKKRSFKKSWWKYALAIFIVGIIGYLGFQAYGVFDAIWDKNRTGQSPFLKLFGKVEAGQLKGEGDGRINVLLLGIPGGNHNGVNLSDTNIVASIDPINNKAAMLSLPRDMWVDNPSTGGSSKLNAIHAYGETQEEGYGPTASKKAVSEILNIPIHYYIRIDFKGVEKLIDALGGVEVEVENDIYDPFFPDQYGSGYSLYSIEEGVHHLNGVEALRYARSRYTTSDFDRAARQQQILMAAKEQLSAKNLFTQPQKILDIIGIAKHHLRTDLNTDEIKRLMSIVEQIDTAEVVSKVLDNSPTGLLVSDNINGASVLLPKDGDFRQIQALAHRIFVEPYLKQEAAKIEIRNGTTIAGLAGQTKEILESYGYTVSKIDDAKRKDYERTFIIDYSGGSKPHSLDLLKKRIGVGELMSDGFVKTEADILIVLGSNFSIDELYR